MNWRTLFNQSRGIEWKLEIGEKNEKKKVMRKTRTKEFFLGIQLDFTYRHIYHRCCMNEVVS
jgi:hypothetical protein